MPALGIGALLFGVAQALVSAFVYSEVGDQFHPPVVPAVVVFLLGVFAAVVVGGVVEVIAVELLLVALYVAARSLGGDGTSSA